MIVENNKMKVIKKKSNKKKMDMSHLSGNNSPKQNGGSESKLKGKKKKNWIAGAIKKPGALHAEMGVKKGSKIPKSRLAAAAAKGGKLGQRARLAQTLEGMHSKKKASSGAKAYMKRVGNKKMGGKC